MLTDKRFSVSGMVASGMITRAGGWRFAVSRSVCGVMLVVALASIGRAQPGPIVAPGLGVAAVNSYPNEQYYLALQLYRDGDLLNASVAFDQAMSRTRKDPNGRWLDAIPVHAMMAECLYQAGDLAGAVDNIDAALALAIRHRGWLRSLTWADLASATMRTPDMAAAWAAPNVPAIYPLPNRISIATGDVDLTAQLRRGGVIESARLTRIDAVEIMRGLATALYRRRVILGDLSGEFEIASQTLEALRYPPDLPPIGRALIGSVRGCGKFAAGDKDALASDVGQSAVLPAGVHPLTPVLLLAAARQMAVTDNYAAAIPLAMRAATAASALGQPEWVGEAMAVAAGCVDGNSARQVQAAATSAAAAHLRRGSLASVGALAAGCDAALTAGDLPGATALLEQLSMILSQRGVGQPRWSAYGEYLTAAVAAGGGGSIGDETKRIDEAVSRLLAFASGDTAGLRRGGGAGRRGRGAAPATPRLYQLALVGAEARGRGVGGRAVDQRLMDYVADPPARVWRNDPVDAIAYLAFDRGRLIGDQIASAVKRGAPVDVWIHCDALLRNRFLSSLPLGGRVHQARRLASTDASLLPAEANTWLAKPPAQMAAMRTVLRAPAPAAGTPESFALGKTLESLATQVALSRQTMPTVAPRPLGDSQDLGNLPGGTALLTFVNVGGALIGTLAIGNDVKVWNVNAARQVPADVSKVLKGIGASGRPGSSRLDGQESWKSEAASLRGKLIPGEHLPALESVEHLVVVPDGPLWYLPFELLPLGDENAPLMGDKLAVRYAATPGLAIYPIAKPDADRPIGTVSQLFFAPRDGAENDRLIGQVVESIKQHEALPGSPAIASNLLGQRVGFLAVFGAVTPELGAPLGTLVSGYDKNPATAPLAAWMRFPSYTPTGIFLPGFRTAAGGAQLGDGRELFMTLIGLQLAGVRDIVISRWPVGGESTAVVSKEFLQELPFEGIEPAWRRAVQALRRSPLNPETEPLLGVKDQKLQELTGDHPLFWAGYLIVSPAKKDLP